MKIKKGDTFKAKCTGFIWHVRRVGRKAGKTIVMWAMTDMGCVEMNFSRTQIKREFSRV